MLPGALLLDEVLLRLPAHFAFADALLLTGVKFRRAVLPGALLEVQFEALATGSCRFRVTDAQGTVADGTISGSRHA